MSKVFFLAALFYFAVTCGCSSSSSNEIPAVVYDTITYEWPGLYSCAYAVPALDSALFLAHGVDHGIIFSLKGITTPGSYQFGLHNGVSVFCERYSNTISWDAKPGGSFILTRIQNQVDSPIFEG